MESKDWRPQTEAQPPVDSDDWRSQLEPDFRQRVVNKIMDTLKRHIPFSGQEGLQEFKQIAIRFEEKTYYAATSQSDYLRKISLKMLTMESKCRNTLPNALPSKSQDSASQNLQSQVQNQSQSAPHQMVSNQSQTRQQLLAQNMQNNIASAGPSSLPNSMAPASGLAQNTMPNVPQNTNMQCVSGISQNSMGNTMNQGVSSNMLTNAQRQMQGRQHTQQVGSQQQQQTQNSQQQYRHQMQHQLLKQKLQTGNNQPPIMQTPLQQGTQEPIMQNSSVMHSSMISGLQKNQHSIQQLSQSVLQPHQQSSLGQQQQPKQTPSIQQAQTQLPQQSMITSQALQQQQHLTAQQPNGAKLQQNQLIAQQSNISDLQQQQQQQQQRLLGQPDNFQNMSSQQQTSHHNMQQQHLHLTGQQSNLSNMHQQQLSHQNYVGGFPQQQIMGTQSGNNNFQSNQHSVHTVQQPKAQVQQNQSASLWPGGGQQAQPQSQSQQRLMSQLQTQPDQLQRQEGLQQQTNSLQHNMQSRMQTPNSLLKQQNMIDQQKQFYQSQRGPTEGPSSSLDSSSQTTNTGDWQEEVYLKIKTMKDMYFADLNEMYQKVSMKLQQLEALPQQTKEQLDKLRTIKTMLEKFMQLLQITKKHISPTLKEKLPLFEKQIIDLLSSNRTRRPVHSMQQGQIIPSQMQSMQQAQQPHLQIYQAQSQDVGVNQQLQSMNLQGSASTMQQSNVSSLQHGSASLSSISSSHQSMVSSLPSTSNIDSGQGTASGSMQQISMTSLQQNPVSAPQQANISSLKSQNGVNMLQSNINSHQSNSNMLPNQYLKQQQEPLIMQNQHLNQQLQNRHFQQQLAQRQQLLHQQQAKQQHASQVSPRQLPQLQQNNVNEKMRQGVNLRPGAFPQHLSTGQRFAHQQLEPGASFPVSSSQILQAASPQISQHSPQIDKQNVLQSIPKSGTPLQSENSLFVPSPSTPLAPSPMPGDAEKPAVSSLSNPAYIGNHRSVVPAASQSLSIGTPGISLSPLFEFGGPDGTHGTSAAVSGKSCLTEQPLDRLLKAVKSISPKALNAAVCDIGSVVSMIDRIAGSAPGNGSRAAVGEDLVAMSKCRMQARTRRSTRAMPLNDNFKRLADSETSELESTATSSFKNAKIEVNHALLRKIFKTKLNKLKIYENGSQAKVFTKLSV